MTIASKSSVNIGRTPLSIAMCAASALTIYHAQTYSQAASHVRTSAMQEKVQGLTGNDLDSGTNTTALFARLDPVTSSWKTSQLSFIEGLTEYSETWPEAGMMRNGQVYRHVPWVRHICDSACSLWPTPTASMDRRGFGIPLHDRSFRYNRSTTLRVQELVGKHGWRIHPNFTEALMGFPLDWSAIEE
jgi:hypothetical protein